MAALLPVGPRPADITERLRVLKGHLMSQLQAARRVMRSSELGFLSPLTFTHPVHEAWFFFFPPLPCPSLCTCFNYPVAPGFISEPHISVSHPCKGILPTAEDPSSVYLPLPLPHHHSDQRSESQERDEETSCTQEPKAARSPWG